jgi:hypothetical protein
LALPMPNEPKGLQALKYPHEHVVFDRVVFEARASDRTMHGEPEPSCLPSHATSRQRNVREHQRTSLRFAGGACELECRFSARGPQCRGRC